jgi:hypothetical protein
MWDLVQDHGFGICVTNAAVFRRDRIDIQCIGFDVVIADEYHKFMRRRKSDTFKYFLSMFRHTECVVLSTGSFLNKDASSSYTAFSIVRPKLFKSYWRFVNTYCHVDDGAFGKQIWGVRNPQAFRELTDRYMAYVPNAVVADQLPKGLRTPEPLMPTDEQMDVYQQLKEDWVAQVKDDIVIAPNAMTVFVRLRQLLCCPKILSEDLGMGAGYEHILDSLEEEPHVVIFVPFRPACDYIADALVDEGYDAFILRGGTTHHEQTAIIQRFEETRGVLICTIGYAEAFDLLSCHTSWFLGYSHVLDDNEQAEGRTQRAISEHDTVFWKYLRHIGTLDEDMMDELSADLTNVNKLLKRPQAFIEALK